MRGSDRQQGAMFSYVSPETMVPANHPLRSIRQMVDQALVAMSKPFTRMYSEYGRPSIAPEKLLRALLLQILFSIRSERLLMEQIGYNYLFRWFIGLNLEEEVWDASTFSKNRDRLLEGDVAREFFWQILEQADRARLTSDEHFSVDGTLIEAWASLKSFRPKGEKRQEPPEDPGNPTVDFHGEKRSNETHESTSDAEARLARKSAGKEARLSYSGNLLIENRNGLIVDTELFQANGTAERDAALAMLERVPGDHRVTVGADKAYDTRDFVSECRGMDVTPHVARNEKRPGGSALDGRTTRHAGYGISQRRRKRIEESFGWLKTIGLLAQTRHRGVFRVGWVFTFAAAAYNVVRMKNLLSPAVQAG